MGRAPSGHGLCGAVGERSCKRGRSVTWERGYRGQQWLLYSICVLLRKVLGYFVFFSYCTLHLLWSEAVEKLSLLFWQMSVNEV